MSDPELLPVSEPQRRLEIFTGAGRRPVDFRKGMDGLAALVQQALRADPFAGDVFVFRSKRIDRMT
jgi:transposase